MRRTTRLLLATTALGLAISLLCLATGRLSVQADPANVPSLVIGQFKITSSNGQFVTLYNTTGSTLDLSKYQLEYFNSYDLSKATSSKLIALSGTVPPHGYFMVNDGSLLLCYQVTVDSASLGLSSTAGLIELLAFDQTSPGGSVTPLLQDYVGWSKTVAGGAQTLPGNANAFLVRRPLNAQNNPAVTVPGSGAWQSVQPGVTNPCDLVSNDTASSAPAAPSTSQLLPATEPSATIVSLANDQANPPAAPTVPAADAGLMAPKVTELLPNPAGTGNDATDEFVELYNPNAAPFDLSGFIVQSGTTSLHTYTFPPGTGLLPHGFTAYYSAATGLSLSNGGGQVELLDPTSKSVSTTGLYAAAEDGQSWALANGKWYWTTSPTPGSPNVVKQPSQKPGASRKTTKTSKAGSSHAKSTNSGIVATAAGDSASSDSVATTVIHPWVLAAVAALALLYVSYEYRTDLANRLGQLRRYLGNRRGRRP